MDSSPGQKILHRQVSVAVLLAGGAIIDAIESEGKETRSALNEKQVLEEAIS